MATRCIPSRGPSLGRSCSAVATVSRGCTCSRHRPIHRDVAARVSAFSAGDFEIERLLGSVGFLSVSSYRPTSQGLGGQDLGLDLRDLQQMAGQKIEEGAVTAKLYQAVCRRGPLSGTRCILKAYPLSKARSDADVMAANEFRAFASLQPPSVPAFSDHVCKLLGAFTVGAPGASEQWLVLRNDGVYTADQYARMASEAFAAGRAVGDGEFWDRLDPKRPLARRRLAVLRVWRGAMEGLAFIHRCNWLHQSLGPTSVTMDTVDENEMRFLRVRLRDLAFAVDVSDQTLLGGSTLAELWDAQSSGREGPGSAGLQGISGGGEDPRDGLAKGLWARAAAEGADNGRERREFGKADDVYAAGLLGLFLCFVPFTRPGDASAGELQRLVEGTFRLDMEAFREYCEADDRWEEPCKFLAEGGGAGWDLLGQMMARDWRARPSVEACLEHPFRTGKALA